MKKKTSKLILFGLLFTFLTGCSQNRVDYYVDFGNGPEIWAHYDYDNHLIPVKPYPKDVIQMYPVN